MNPFAAYLVTVTRDPFGMDRPYIITVEIVLMNANHTVGYRRVWRTFTAWDSFMRWTITGDGWRHNPELPFVIRYN